MRRRIDYPLRVKMPQIRERITALRKLRHTGQAGQLPYQSVAYLKKPTTGWILGRQLNPLPPTSYGKPYF